ncbi:MAG: hypothetical protein KF823_15270 [Xanthomonadales bacterium]|nr:hypothetical protein [Xanthomonadales bacterium]
MDTQTDFEALAELVVIWRKLARLHAADPHGPARLLMSPVASEALTLAGRLGVDPALVLEEGGAT